MQTVSKACPIVLRMKNGRRELLAFRHPVAGRRLIKGAIASGEAPQQAALRELWETCGVVARVARPIGEASIGKRSSHWWFCLASCDAETLPDGWRWPPDTDDDHVFELFWHPLDEALCDAWRPNHRDALGFVRSALNARRGTREASSGGCVA